MPCQPRLLFLDLSNGVGADRIVAAMRQSGAECGVLGSRDGFAARSRATDVHFPLPAWGGALARSLFVESRLDRVAKLWQPDLVVPLDEAAAHLLREPSLYARAGTEVRRLIEGSLGPRSSFKFACSRRHFIEMAAALGIATPVQAVVADLAAAKRAAAAVGYPVVLKRDQTCGGGGVDIVHDAAGLSRAFRHARLKTQLKARLRSLCGFRCDDPSELVLQRYVPGALAFRAVACARGHAIEGISFAAERTHPAKTGASTMVRPIENPAMTEATNQLVAALGCTGLLAFDFLLASEDVPLLIEMNARPIASGHLGRLFGHDLYAALVHHLGGTPMPARPLRHHQPVSIALFPRELDRDPQSFYRDQVSNCLYDIPWDDPAMLERYIAWLQRRHPVHRLRLKERLRLDEQQQGTAAELLLPS